jgi:GAF domain-containing protein/uncharacterized membrane protein
LLASVLVLIMGLLLMLTAINTAGAITGSLSNAGQFLVSDIATLAVFIALWLLNRNGLGIWVGTFFILFMIVIPGFVFLPEDFDRLLIVYAIPIVLSGFIIHPLAALAALALSIGGYSYVFYSSDLGLTYNYVGIEVLVVISALTSIVSSLMGNALQTAQKNEESQREANARLQALQASLEQQVEERTHQVRVAAEVAQSITTAGSVTEILQKAARLICEHFGYSHAGIYLLDAEGHSASLSASAGQVPSTQPSRLKAEEDTIIGWVLVNHKAYLEIEAGAETKYLPNPLFPHTRSEAAFPILARERLLGVLDIHSQQSDAFDETMMLALQIVAGQVAAAIQNLQLVEAAQVNLASISEVYRYGHMIAQANTEFDVFEATRRSLAESAYGAILLIAEENGFLVAMSTTKDPLPEWIDLQPGELEEIFAAGSIIGEVKQFSNLPLPFLRTILRTRFENVALLPVRRNDQLKAILVVGAQANQTLLPVAIQPYASMAELAISSLERIRSEATVESRLNELEAITITSRALASVNDLDTLFSVLHEHVRKNMGDITFIVALYEADTNSINIPYMFENAPGSEKSEIESFPLGEGLTSILIRTKQPLMLVEDTERRAAALGAKVSGKPAKSWLGTPLIVSNDVIGAIIVQDSERENVFDESDLRFLTTLSAQVAGAIYNIRLIEETRKRALQLQTAAEIARDISGSLDVSELLAKAIALIRERFNFYHAAVFLIDPSGTFAVIREATGEAGAQMKRASHKLKVGSKSIVGYVTGSGEHLVVNDTRRDATYYANPLLPDTRSEIAIPLKVGQRVVGALDVQSDKAYAFSADDINVLRILADQLAVAVVNSELFAETQEHLSQHRLLHHVTTAAASGTTLEEALNSAAQGLQVTLGGDRVAILLADRAKKLLKVEAVAGFSEEVQKVQIPFGEGITGWVAVHQKPQRINDVQSDARYIEIGSNTRSELAIPLSYRGELLGVLNVESDQPGAYSENDEELLGTLGGSLAAIIANARLLEQIRRQIDRERLLYEVTSKIRRSTDMQTIMATTASELSKALGARRAKIALDVPPKNESAAKNDQEK